MGGSTSVDSVLCSPSLYILGYLNGEEGHTVASSCHHGTSNLLVHLLTIVHSLASLPTQLHKYTIYIFVHTVWYECIPLHFINPTSYACACVTEMGCWEA